MAEKTCSASSSCGEDSTVISSHLETNVGDGEQFNYDDILKHIGQLGSYQFRTFLLLCLPALFPGIIVMSYTFTGGMPNYR